MSQLVPATVHYTLLAELSAVTIPVGNLPSDGRMNTREQDVVKVSANTQVLNYLGEDLALLLQTEPAATEVFPLEHPNVDGGHLDLLLAIVFPLRHVR